MNVYFVRHGESEGNLKQIHQAENTPLSKKGIKQAKAVAERLRSAKIDVLYSSPYLRAKQTAEIISRAIARPVEPLEALKEFRRPSELSGLNYSDPRAKAIKSIIRKNQVKSKWRYSDDESYFDLLQRARSVAKRIDSKHKGQNVLCVSHIQTIVSIVLLMLLQDELTSRVFWQFYYHSRHENTGITHLKNIENLGWNFVAWNDTTHL